MEMTGSGNVNVHFLGKAIDPRSNSILFGDMLLEVGHQFLKHFLGIATEFDADSPAAQIFLEFRILRKNDSSLKMNIFLTGS
jgi:hypothetical protein